MSKKEKKVVIRKEIHVPRKYLELNDSFNVILSETNLTNYKINVPILMNLMGNIGTFYVWEIDYGRYLDRKIINLIFTIEEELEKLPKHTILKKLEDLKKEDVGNFPLEKTINELNGDPTKYLIRRMDELMDEEDILNFKLDTEQLEKIEKAEIKQRIRSIKKEYEFYRIRLERSEDKGLVGGSRHKRVEEHPPKAVSKAFKEYNKIEEVIWGVIDDGRNKNDEEKKLLMAYIKLLRKEQEPFLEVIEEFKRNKQIIYLNEFSNYTLQGILNVQDMLKDDDSYYLFQPYYIYVPRVDEIDIADLKFERSPMMFYGSPLEDDLIIDPKEETKFDYFYDIVSDAIKTQNKNNSMIHGYPIIYGYSISRYRLNPNQESQDKFLPSTNFNDVPLNIKKALKSFKPSPSNEFHIDTTCSTIINSRRCILFTHYYLFRRNKINFKAYKTENHISNINRYFDRLLSQESDDYQKSIKEGFLYHASCLYSIEYKVKILIKCDDVIDKKWELCVIDGEMIHHIQTKEQYKQYEKYFPKTEDKKGYRDCIKYSFYDKHCAPSSFKWKEWSKSKKIEKEAKKELKREKYRLVPIINTKGTKERDVKVYSIEFKLNIGSSNIEAHKFVVRHLNEEYLFKEFDDLLGFIDKKVRPTHLSKTNDTNSQKTYEFWTFEGSIYLFPLLFNHYISEYPGIKTYCISKTHCRKLKVFNIRFRDLSLLYPGTTKKELLKTFECNNILEVARTHLKNSYGKRGDRYYDMREHDTRQKYSQSFYQQAYQIDKLWGSPFYKEERESFLGGRDNVFKKNNIVNGERLPAYEYDIKSSHPAAACKIQPMKPIKRYNPECVYKINNITDYHLYCVTGYTNSIIPSIVSKHDGEIIAFKKSERVWIWGDILKEHLIDHGSVIVHSHIEYEGGYPFNEYMNEMFIIKSDDKNKKLIKLMAKNNMNYFYGSMSITDKPKLKLCNQGEEDMLEMKYKIVGRIDWFDDRKLIKYIENKSTYFNSGNLVRFSSKISSGTATNLQKTMRAIGYENVLGCNTDSIFSLKPPQQEFIGKEIGMWEDKLQGKLIDKIRFYTKKTRVMTLTDGTKEIKASGMSKNKIKNDQIKKVDLTKGGDRIIMNKDFGSISYYIKNGGNFKENLEHRIFDEDGNSKPFENEGERNRYKQRKIHLKNLFKGL